MRRQNKIKHGCWVYMQYSPYPGVHATVRGMYLTNLNGRTLNQPAVQVIAVMMVSVDPKIRPLGLSLYSLSGLRTIQTDDKVWHARDWDMYKEKA